MGFLKRRVTFLIDQLKNGKLKFSKDLLKADDGKRLKREISAIKTLQDGTVDLSTCSPLVRSTAKAVYFVGRAQDQQESNNRDTENITTEAISALVKEYFQLLEEFFIEATGTKPEKFASREPFGDRIRREARKLGKRLEKAWEDYIPRIGQFHGKHSRLLLRSSKAIGGLKYVMGGSSRFTEGAFNGFRKFALYADTIFVPDPILPWIEVERAEEKFRHVSLLEACHNLLFLKPIADAALPYPALVIFPSWEKSLEISDEETKDGISALVLGFFSHYLNASFEDESEIVEYVTGSGRQAFRKAVDKHGLFLPPGTEKTLRFNEEVKQYKNYIKTWRSPEWVQAAESWSDEGLVLNGIWERITPQFHIRDNARTMQAQPLFWLSQHFHYFHLCSQAGNDELEQSGLIKSKTLASIQSLLHPNIAWLGNVPIKHLVRLREENRNEEFRRHLSSYLDQLSESEIGDIDRVATEVVRGIASLMVQHNQDAKRIEEEYQKKHINTLGLSILTAGASMYPWLTPFLGLPAVLAPIGKLAFNLYEEYQEHKTLSRSLMAVLSRASN